MRTNRAFSLIEIMVTVTLLAVIILGLVTMFNQTQRAFTTSLNQVDVLANGRTAAEMLSRELGQLTASGTSNTNFFVTNLPVGNNIWPLVTAGDLRTNTFDQLFFLTKYNVTWKGIWYAPLLDVSGAVATLYRYETGLNSAFLTNTNAILDGIVHFRVLAFDRRGALIQTNNFIGTEQSFTNGPSFIFTSNAMPAYAVVEFGILETRTYQRYLSMLNTNLPPQPQTLALNYLTNHAAQVHIFRQRIAMQAYDPVKQ